MRGSLREFRAPVLAAIATAVFVTAAAHAPAPAWGTSGGTDDFGGHTPTEKSATAKHPAGVYHCHGKPDTLKRKACELRLLVDVQERKLIAAESELTHTKATAARVSEQNATLHATIEDLRRGVRAAQAGASRARSERDVARRIAQTKTAERDRAVRDMREAEARAAGTGPPVSSRCRDAVQIAVKKGGWFGGWDDAAKEALRKGCLYE